VGAAISAKNLSSSIWTYLGCWQAKLCKSGTYRVGSSAALGLPAFQEPLRLDVLLPSER
jgi:hypothetical protein